MFVCVRGFRYFDIYTQYDFAGFRILSEQLSFILLLFINNLPDVCLVNTSARSIFVV